MRRAVLVASSDFKDSEAFPPLRFPTQDAARLREVLVDRELCFFDEAELISNGNATAAVRALERFARASEPDDLLLFYYSGHGQLDRDGTLALAMPESERDYLSTTSLISDELKRLFRMSRATHKIMILDCCYSGAASDAQFKGSLNDTISALAHQIAGSFLLTASSRFEPAFESETLKGGALTSCLIEGIATGAAAPTEAESITLAQLASYVRKKVPGFGAQQPQSWDLGGIGDLPLARKRRALDSAWARRARQKVTLWAKSKRFDDDMADDIGRAIRNRQDARFAGQVALIDQWVRQSTPASQFVREWDRIAAGSADPAGTVSEPTSKRPGAEKPPETPPRPRPLDEDPPTATAVPAGGSGGAEPPRGADPLSGLLSSSSGGAEEPVDLDNVWTRRFLVAAILALVLYAVVAALDLRDPKPSFNNTFILTDDALMGANDVTDVDGLNVTDANLLSNALESP